MALYYPPVVSNLIDESGAATVEWVVMTSASVAIGLSVMSYVSDGVESLSNEIRGAMSDFTIMTSFDQWGEFRNQQIAVSEPAASGETPTE